MIVGTAGHVDHGKSTVVRLLTGTDPDRWAEEHRRGLTIGLGFGFTDLCGTGSSDSLTGTRAGVVDVPGHGRFLPTMLQGAHAVDVAMLVVAATEGWMPQTAEHVAVLDVLGTRRGVVVITHVDKVADARVAEVTDDLRLRLAGTFLADAVADPSSTVRLDVTGTGLEDLRAALRKAVSDAAADRPGGPACGYGRPRVWVDRSFSLRGLGRVSTGTLTGGDLAVGDPVDVLSRDGAVDGTTGGTRSSTISSMHVHGEAVREVGSGNRVGIRLTDKAAAPAAADALVRAEQWGSGRHLHAAVRTFDCQTELRQRRGYELMVGTARWSVELRRSPRVPGPLLSGTMSPGPVVPDSPAGSSGEAAVEWQPVRIHATEPVAPVAPGDRFVLVDSGTSRAVAGGVLLAVDRTVLRRDERSLQRRLDAVLAGDEAQLALAMVDEVGPVQAAPDVRAALGRVPDCLQHDASMGLVFDRAALERSVERLVRALARHSLDRGPTGGVVVDDDPLVRFAAGLLAENGRAVLREGRLWPDESSHHAARSNADRAVGSLAGANLWRRAELVEAVAAAGLPSSAVSAALRSGALVELSACEAGSDAGEVGPRSREGRVVSGAVRPSGTRTQPRKVASARIVSAGALERCERLVVERLGRSPARLGELRDLLELSRSETLLVLGHLDAEGLTRREGDERMLAR